uniref:RNA exonuclease 1 homolog n=1 Tax=Pristiophorus japonicus TaxID=55135 RepID=UPI00398EB9E2
MKYVHSRHEKTWLWNSLHRTPNSSELETALPNPNHVYKSPEADVPTDLTPNALEKPACTVLELEKVSKAIEVVKTEVEQQQHRLLMCKSFLECENHNTVTLSTNSEYSCASSSTSTVNYLASTKSNPTFVFECEAQDTRLDSVYSPTPVSSHSLSKHPFNVLNEVNEEDTFQYIPMVSSKIKNTCSVLNKYVIERRKPSTDLEYDPLVNYSSNLKQSIKKEYMEEKQEFKRVIEQSPEKKCPLASKTARSFQPFETEMSSDGELVIDMPELPPPPQNPRVHRRLQRKENYANTSNLSLIRKVRHVRDSINPVLDVEKSVDNSVAEDLMSENSSSETELNSGALQRKKTPDLNESSKSSNLTNVPMNKAGRHHDLPKHGFKVKRIEEPLKLELVKKENSIAHVTANKVKLSNQKYRKDCVSAKLDKNVHKCEKTKEQSLIHLDKLKKSNDKGPQAGSESRNASLKIDQQVISAAMKCDRQGTANKSKCTSNVGAGLSTSQQEPMIQNQADHFGNENWEKDLQTTSDNEESSPEELNSTATEDLDFSESDPMEECLRIFNESSKQEIEDSGTDTEQNTVGKTYENIQDSGNAESCNVGQKKRIAHVAKFNKGRSSCNRIIIPRTLPMPKQRCHNRIRQVQQQAVQLMANVKSAQVYKAIVSDCPERKKLIVQGFKLQPRTNSKRGSKVSNNVRKQYLGFFIEEFLKTCSSRQEAIKKALSEEKAIFERSTSKFMYLNVAVHALKILRNPANRGLVVSGHYSAKRRRSSSRPVLEGAALYRVLKNYVLTEGQLKESGYPRYSTDKPGAALLFNGEAKKYIADSLIRVCCHCGTSFSVTPEGNYISKEECNHHWGRVITRQVPGGWETRYGCCEGSLGSVGCQVAKLHVYNRKENLNGFMKTSLKLLPLDGNPGVYAVNSEICYTKQGGELARVSVISANLEVVYDVFVKPDNEVIDYNTRFSGVTQEDIMNAKTTLCEVQAALLTTFSADTILIGHSLDKDLLALKLIHSMVIDTSVLFPHRLGIPHKRALRSLMADYLRQIVPDNVVGPQSAEHGCACMELVMWKVKEDAKARKW